MGVFVVDTRQRLAHVDFDGKFLANLSCEAGSEGFTFFDLATGELPETSQHAARWTAGQQQPILFPDDPGRDFHMRPLPSWWREG